MVLIIARYQIAIRPAVRHANPPRQMIGAQGDKRRGNDGE